MCGGEGATAGKDKNGRGVVEEATLQREGLKKKRLHRAIKHTGVTREEPMWQKSK